MSIFFCGEVSKEEIIIYLQNKKHSLINNLKLRNDILTKNHFLFDLLVKPTIKIKRIAPRRILEEKNIFLKNEKIEKKCEKILENTQIYKQVLKKNTKRNSGYKNIRIFYRSNLKNNVKKVEKIESKVKFSDFIENKPHNNGEIKSILRCKTNKVTEQKTPIKKRNVFVLSQTPEEEFSFEYEVLN